MPQQMKNKNKDNQVFLEHKRKKKWTEQKTGHACFVIYARALYITMSHLEYWKWNCFKEISDENIEVVKLQSVCWFDVRGKFKISDLSPGVLYEIAYVVKLKNSAAGWELPVTLELTHPADGNDEVVKRRQISLLEKPKEEWLELNVGNFLAKEGETKEVCFNLYEHGGHWKSGLVIKGAIIRPKVIV